VGRGYFFGILEKSAELDEINQDPRVEIFLQEPLYLDDRNDFLLSILIAHLKQQLVKFLLRLLDLVIEMPLTDS
jgi:hypothetical protein